MTSCVALIVAAGRGERFGGDRPKQYQDLGGRAVLHHTVSAFLRHDAVGAVQVVIQPAHRELYDAAVAGLDLPEPVAGGATRQDSVRLGLERLATRDPMPEFVLIHDAARPLIDADTIRAVRRKLDDVPAAIAAVAVTDTLKRGDEAGMITGTIDRAGLMLAQTPQGFRFPDILKAHRDLAGAALTDDAAVAENAGLGVALVQGNADNLKVTNQDDMARAALIMNAALHDVRTGLGFDVHRFASGDHVVLCGVKVPHEARLDGHSDADVGLHALTDAILGALAAGDIGSHFPPSDPRWKGADSQIFLTHARDLVTRAGGVIDHVDLTIICEAPKVGPHRDAIREQIGRAHV